ncbi:alpha/beta fold hydrolase [Thermostaphylospora chromogena]|uniref:Pimeloyl-ACP methyl ester carboxylesterase n=1 Tax=Thermostaphylospora chromogena TaxID=35622 RepID=A0A1H0ZSU5_9ACTN|nr:alpha/beta hydrolase [Thermostaphylospora chromogena]SDQ30493.1 Pimeloyl-ACP methyl ester carboxylesterase [Thermostaphylospora chromogena]
MKREFLLLPGAWSGAWLWESVVRRLGRRGFPARAITLRGLSDGRADVSDVGLETHVNDVLALLRAEDLRGVVLVGHSYSGLVAGLVADRARDRVAHTVFVEAFLPHHGRSMLHAFPERQRRQELQLIDANQGRWPAPDHTVVGDGQDLTGAQARWLAERLVGHPGRTVAEPVTLRRPLAQQRASYVVCSRDHIGGRIAADVAAMRAAPTWDFHTLDAGHWPMISAPGPLTDLLVRIAGRDA